MIESNSFAVTVELKILQKQYYIVIYSFENSIHLFTR
jgi:hypothetical protein